MEKVRLSVEGMSCDHCLRSVDGAIRGVAGVEEVEVTMGAATVTFDPQATDVQRVLEAVEEEGYVVYQAEESGP